MNKQGFVAVAAVLLTCSGAAYVAVPVLWGGGGNHPGAEPPGDAAAPPVVCTGIVEPVFGEIDLIGQIAGEIVELRVQEGDWVEKGQVLAVLDARREAAAVAVAEADVHLAKARLAQLKAGAGREEREEARLAVEAVEALAAYEEAHVQRLRSLHDSKAVMLEQLQQAEHQWEHRTRRAESLRQRHAALQRGPLPEEVAAAEAEVALAEERLRRAQVQYGYREVRAPFAGHVAAVHRHAGDSVSLEQFTPILRIIDTERLQVRLEIEESDALWLQPGVRGAFHVRGGQGEAGRLVVRTVLPQFGPKRLFTPDTSAHLDTRALQVLCDIVEAENPLYSGQRITAHIPREAVGSP